MRPGSTGPRRGGWRSLHRETRIPVLFLLLYLIIVLPESAKGQNTVARVEIISPSHGATVGGVVPVLGTVTGDSLVYYDLALGLGSEPHQWIPIGKRRADQVPSGPLGFWDTTQIPDGVYSLRLRALRTGDRDTYVDAYVRPVFVSNAAQADTPTLTPTPTETPTAFPERELADGVSPYLYVVVTPQSDLLCVGRQQWYSIWLSNVGMIPLTHVRVVDILPASCLPVLTQSTQGTLFDEGTAVQWDVGKIAPGAVVKIELQVEVPSWLSSGTWLHNEVRVSSDQLPYVGKTVRTLLSSCPLPKETIEARPLELPTVQPRSASAPTPTTAPVAKPALQLTPTQSAFTVSEETVGRGLDTYAIVVAAGLGILTIMTGVLLSRRLSHRR